MNRREIRLSSAFNFFRKKWILIFTTTAIGAALSIAYSLSLPNIYKADTLIAASDDSSSGGLAEMAGNLGGLAAIAGVNLGGQSSSQADLAIQVISSRKFIRNFINKYELLVPLMAVNDWEQSNNKLIIDERLYNVTREEWLREPRGLRGKEPSMQEAYERFMEVFSVNKNDETGLITLSVSFFSPYVAREWLDKIVIEINEAMRNRAIVEAQNNLDYLERQLEKTSIAEMQSTFYKLVEEQMKSLMLAEAQDEFVFKVIDPPIVPEVKSSPSRALICLSGSIFSLMLALLYCTLCLVTHSSNGKAH